MQRFRNSALPHRTQQIAMDGSQKLPQRLLGTVRDRISAGAAVAHLALAIAGWIRYASGSDENHGPIAVADPLAQTFAEIVRDARGDPGAIADGFLDLKSVFGADLVAHYAFREAVRNNVITLFRDGAQITLARHLGVRDVSRLRGPSWQYLNLHPDRVPCPWQAHSREAPVRDVKDLPIVSPHGIPTRNGSPTMLHSPTRRDTPDRFFSACQPGPAPRGSGDSAPDAEADPTRARICAFAANYHLFRGTPTRIWLDHAFKQCSASMSV